MRKTWNSVWIVTWFRIKLGALDLETIPGTLYVMRKMPQSFRTLSMFLKCWMKPENPEDTNTDMRKIWNSIHSYLSTGSHRESWSCEAEMLPSSPALFLDLGYNHRNRAVAGDVASGRKDKCMSCLWGTRLSLSLSLSMPRRQRHVWPVDVPNPLLMLFIICIDSNPGYSRKPLHKKSTKEKEENGISEAAPLSTSCSLMFSVSLLKT